jgi:hypothetical protein
MQYPIAVTGGAAHGRKSPKGFDAVPCRPLDAAAYERRSREGPCFVYDMLAKDPPLLGATLVVPAPIGIT